MQWPARATQIEPQAIEGVDNVLCCRGRPKGMARAKGMASDARADQLLCRQCIWTGAYLLPATHVDMYPKSFSRQALGVKPVCRVYI